MRAINPKNVYYLYEFLKKHNGHVSDCQIVTAFRNATSDEIFDAKCLFEDSKKKHNLLAGRRCHVRTNNQYKSNTNSKNKIHGKRKQKKADVP